MIGLNYLGKMGQLGNQMFQYAALRGIANNLGLEYTVPNHNEAVDDGIGNILRIELYDAFDIKPPNLGLLQTNDYIQEAHFHFDENLYNTCKDNCSIVGFFQSYKYFSNIRDEIVKDFTVKKEYRDDCKSIIKQLDNPIALHIRRGDFLINSANHYNLSMSYYKNALDCFDNNRQVIIFSDDPDWCFNHELFSDDRFIVTKSDSPYHDLYLMTKCDDFIIANSTFSWWGAWLCTNPDKVVLYPDKWFGPNNQKNLTHDLFPNDWRMINEN